MLELSAATSSNMASKDSTGSAAAISRRRRSVYWPARSGDTLTSASIMPSASSLR